MLQLSTLQNEADGITTRHGLKSSDLSVALPGDDDSGDDDADDDADGDDDDGDGANDDADNDGGDGNDGDDDSNEVGSWLVRRLIDWLR